MVRKIVMNLFVVFFALGILSVSLLRSARVKYAFEFPKDFYPEKTNGVKIEYPLPYPGRVLPNHILWPLKVVRDKAWVMVMTDPIKKSEVLLLLADKRLMGARELFDKGDVEMAVATFQKAEVYLNEAVEAIEKVNDREVEKGKFLERLCFATLKHRQILEEVLVSAPEDAAPIIVRTLDYPKRLFESVVVSLRELGRSVPNDPF